jgi:hypothetical protein
MKVGQRGRWTYRDWIRWRFLWKFFPWYAREMRYRGDFCIGQGCMHWRWEDAEKRERAISDPLPGRVKSIRFALILRRRTCKRLGDGRTSNSEFLNESLHRNEWVLFAVLEVLHVWRLVVEWPGIRTEFWIVACGSILSAVLALWALKLLLALKRTNRPPSAAG